MPTSAAWSSARRHASAHVAPLTISKVRPAPSQHDPDLPTTLAPQHHITDRPTRLLKLLNERYDLAPILRWRTLRRW
ncbi:MAG: hypothetical protein ACM34D_09100 [Gemmatimonadota bacterium]